MPPESFHGRIYVAANQPFANRYKSYIYLFALRFAQYESGVYNMLASNLAWSLWPGCAVALEWSRLRDSPWKYLARITLLISGHEYNLMWEVLREISWFRVGVLILEGGQFTSTWRTMKLRRCYHNENYLFLYMWWYRRSFRIQWRVPRKTSQFSSYFLLLSS